MAEEVAQCMDVDEQLAGDEHLRKDMISQSAELLARARYSPEAYEKWVAAGAPTSG